VINGDGELKLQGRQDEASRIRMREYIAQEKQNKASRMREKVCLIQEQKKQMKAARIRERELRTQDQQLAFNSSWSAQQREDAIKKFANMNKKVVIGGKAARARDREDLMYRSFALNRGNQVAMGGRAARIRDREEIMQRRFVTEREEFVQALNAYTMKGNFLTIKRQETYDDITDCAPNVILQDFTPEDDNAEARKNMIAMGQEAKVKESYYDMIQS